MYEKYFIDWDTKEMVHVIESEEVERRPATDAEMHLPLDEESPS